MKYYNKDKCSLKEFRNMLINLIKEDKIKFNFYNNSLLDLDLLQICYNEMNDTLELDFRDIMGEHLKELKKIMK